MTKQEKNISMHAPSITEWMEKIKMPSIKKLRHEDSTKRDRLHSLYLISGLPYLRAVRTNIKELLSPTRKSAPAAQNTKFLFKLLPTSDNDRKLRIRGVSMKKGIEWVKKQNINQKKYKVEIVPYDDKAVRYSAVFCINENGIWGEIIQGSIWQFSTGGYKKSPIIFLFNYKQWFFSHQDANARSFIFKTVRHLHITEKNKREKIKKVIKAEFTAKNHYLKGYFECSLQSDKIVFIDYNRVLFKILRGALITISGGIGRLSGVCIGPGQTRGRVRIVLKPRSKTIFKKDEILVCRNATYDYLPLIRKASGIITEQGTILSHPAIVSRELRKPYVADVKNVTKKLKTGDEVLLDATQGIVKIII